MEDSVNLGLGPEERAIRRAGSQDALRGSSSTSTPGRLARDTGDAITLTRGEFALLRAFVARPDRVLSRDALLDAVAKRTLEPFDRSIDVLVGRLRKEIEGDPKTPRLIVTVPEKDTRFVGLRSSHRRLREFADADGAAKRKATPISGRTSEGTRPPSEAASRTVERRHITALVAELVWAKGDSPNDPEDLRVVIDTFPAA